MPRDPQGAGTRGETRVEWRNVYADGRVGIAYVDRWMLDLPKHLAVKPPRIAVERIETTTTITRIPVCEEAGK